MSRSIITHEMIHALGYYHDGDCQCDDSFYAANCSGKLLYFTLLNLNNLPIVLVDVSKHFH